MRRTVLVFGALSAVISVTMLFLELPLVETLGYRKADLIGYASMVLTALVLFFGVRWYREHAGAGRMSFARGLGVGVAIALVSSLCYVVAFQLVYFQLRPGIGDKYVACMVERVRDRGADAEEVEKAERQAHALKRLWDRPLSNAALTFAEPFPVGLIAAAISAAILRRR